MDTVWVVLLWLAGLLVAAVLLTVLVGVVYRITSRTAGAVRLDGKTVLITGASAGIGKESAYALAGMGAKVILACRNLDKSKPIADDIIQKTGNGKVFLMHMDISDLDSVRKFAEEFNRTEEHLHVLLNNAGIGGKTPKELTKQGFELTMGTNHYGCFLLTNLLIGKLKSSAPSRIVTVSSLMHMVNTLHLDDLNFERRPYSQFFSYAQSKLCNILFSNELARRLDGSGVTSNCLHPGFVVTEIFDKSGGSFFGWLANIVGRTTVQGAQTSIYLASSPEVEGKTGGYYDNCRKTTLYRKAADVSLGRQLWQQSVKEVQLTDQEADVWAQDSGTK